MLTKMKYLNLAIIFIVLQFFIFYVTPKQIPIGKRVQIPDDRWFMDSNFECPLWTVVALTHQKNQLTETLSVKILVLLLGCFQALDLMQF